MSQKSFFRDKTIREIRDIKLKKIYTQNNLIKRILDLDPSVEGIELRSIITPSKYLANKRSGARSSRLNFKHGNYIRLSQPRTQSEAHSCKDIPLKIRERDFNQLTKLKEVENNFLGYVFRPVQGKVRSKRIVPFWSLLEGARLYAYSEQASADIKIENYKDSKRVSREGATIVCEVPSRTKKHPRYKFALEHVPVDGTTEKRGVVWSINPKILLDDESFEPILGRTAHELYNIRYTPLTSREESKVITFYPHDVAAYAKIIDKLWNEERNITPLEMSPFALPSQKGVDIYKKISNNLLVYDKTLKSKHKLRKPHLNEVCTLFGRSVGILGPKETLYCDEERDGKLKNYDWKV
jgi:hypothetical protein